ncbi:MAG TPA: DUF4382 domain-containing protein [Geothrix sp.]|jgi:hypothetical protein
MRLRPFLASPLLCLGLTLACGSSSSPSIPTGTLTLRLGSDSFPGYSQAMVSLEKLEASPDGATWIPLGNVKATFDLMALQSGHSALILPATRVDAGSYAQFRLTWATVSYQAPVIGQPPAPPAYVIPTGGSGLILSMPVTTVVSGPITVAASGTTTAQIMLNGQHAVQVRTGPTFTFQPTGRAYDLAASASITGHLGDGATSLVGVEAFAETVDGLGTATLQRRAYTDASGNYVLECLPTGSLYFVAAQPASLTNAYAAAAAAPVNATAATAYTANLAFSAPQVPGSLTLTITPASTATQGTWGELRQSLATGGTGSQFLIVRSQTVASSAASDQVTFLGLAPSIYGLTAQRSTSGAAPAVKIGAQVSVSAGATATTALSFP